MPYADTEITYVNFGRDYITNLSYVLSPPDYPQTLIDKYNAYLAYCERRRKEYADTWTQYLGLQAQKSALLNRMPIDAVTSQWNAYELADLTVELEKFKAMQKALEDIYASGNIENSPDYALYMSIKTVIIPDIEAEIKRQQSQTSEPAEKTDYTFNWELYGINGLKERRRTCENSANASKRKGGTVFPARERLPKP